MCSACQPGCFYPENGSKESLLLLAKPTLVSSPSSPYNLGSRWVSFWLPSPPDLTYIRLPVCAANRCWWRRVFVRGYTFRIGVTMVGTPSSFSKDNGNFRLRGRTKILGMIWIFVWWVVVVHTKDDFTLGFFRW